MAPSERHQVKEEIVFPLTSSCDISPISSNCMNFDHKHDALNMNNNFDANCTSHPQEEDKKTWWVGLGHFSGIVGD